jgi:hypothetical protein
LVVNVSLDRCRLVWLSEKESRPVSQLLLRSDKGAVIEVGVQAVSTEHAGSVWIVDYRFKRPLTVPEMAAML